ncbi:hypothetical protein SRS16CHR_01971 [Variovorax sp. SRS16]|uniref:hypothetical protein n=1 Tax=Variovorax sp. SRS16 TaxID=282217 RepID=UPI001316D8A5|nr:hypothetical protein [Variovorax sp. SRS16]VTU17209.1 hypothetical protein SRS16CHR_01971 [Variovorax sp. SRS16]
MDEDDEVKRIEHEGWEIRICLTAQPSEGQLAGHADLWRDGVHSCRIALSGHFPDAASACDALERKARDWISDWAARDHTGDTGFASL